MSHSVLIRRACSICIFAILLLSAEANVSAQNKSLNVTDFDFPYQAIVRRDNTEIFSGPASVHYKTDKIAQGEIVQVYRHDPGGWCAIQPNQGSFSLIPEAAVEIVGDNLGEIMQDNTQAWVGTRLGSVEKPLWQVKLEAGEEVEILGEASWPSPDGHSTIWYQIAPPAGEFRWVRFADLQTPPTDTRPVADAQTSELALSRTRSGFKYDDPIEPESDAEDVTSSGFQYVAVQQRETVNVENSFNADDAKPVADGRVTDGRVPNGHVPDGRVPNRHKSNDHHDADWQWANSGHDSPQPSDSPHVAASNRKASQIPATAKPARQSEGGIDFKFRPIGQTVSLSGQFESTTDKTIIRDSAVAPAAYQSPVFDSAARSPSQENIYDRRSQPSSQFATGESRWQRGRNELAERRMQYESKYDQFNDRIQVDRRDIEDSFGVRMEELPDHPRSYTDRYFGGDMGRYQTLPANNYPPADRFASLNTDFDMHPHSTLAEKLTPRLSKIEEQLTNEMLKRPNEWQLADIELSAGQIYSQTSNPVERLQAQRILDKISKWKVIRNGYTKSFQASGETFGTSVRSLSNTLGPQLDLGGAYQTEDGIYSSASHFGSESHQSPSRSPRGAIIGSGVNTDFEMNARFDATGWLTELVSEDRNNRPVYVLVNDAGQITHHVAGTPGLNLHRYLKSKVGVSGRLGYNNRMKLDHITAELIDELQR